jgi:hypothetical protein
VSARFAAESWYEFDVWRATRTGDLARQVDARIAEQPALRRHRGPLLRALRRAAADAEQHGALMCAVMGEQVDSAGTLAAVLMAVQTPGAPDPADNTPEAVAAQLTSVPQQRRSTHWRRIELLDLPAGRAVRVRAIEPVTSGARTLDCVVMHTLTPFPDGAGVLDLVLTSPQTHLAEPMFDLFDAISGTLAWSPGTTRTATTTTEGT